VHPVNQSLEDSHASWATGISRDLHLEMAAVTEAAPMADAGDAGEGAEKWSFGADINQLLSLIINT